ncbi:MULTISPECIES: reverse transcriptase domain-containing protein [Bacillus]|uniref:reverse transcriptase domain-containing protein n=1 Tax=Bacillus TaxID=1386 RepID=UPI00077E8020|nr:MULTISPECIES: reverse transcriptase domain-containing protein [Bacillus]AMR52312.1 hypothetical protein A1R12_18810 [Bacillus amyloliquefaciens]MCQ9150192.1 reverse transcriptase domain-containing protein [Bacillus amyloliquefaciens]PAE76765.1 hypothetical protein CHH82_09470 [Bacillus velezensis]QGU49401.1 hypothetical protein GG619_19060 [Bacillus velezensis]UBQ46443.1 hypothetical protein LCH16_19705 [Bacillus velezensis]
MIRINSIKELTFEYVISLKNYYNPQTIANSNYLRSLGRENALGILDSPLDLFFSKYKPYKVRDFVYKNDYFTPRNMFLIHPLYYLYYTYLVFLIADESFRNKQIDFSDKNMKVFYSGYLDLGFSKKQITENGMYNKSYKLFQKEQKKYRGKPALKIDIKDFFNSIKIKELIKILKISLGDIKYVKDLEKFLQFCGFDYLPQFHYSIASSILSQFYLTNFDIKIRELLVRENLQLIRYVDDMYLIYLDGIEDRKKNNDILNEISFYLWEDSLVLNTSKTEMLSVSQYHAITESLSENYEDENYKRFSSGSLIENKALEIVEGGNLNLIIDTLCNIEEDYGVDLQKYKALMEDYVAINGGEIKKILNNIIFSRKWEKLNTKDLNKLTKNWKYIFFNPDQFTVLYLMVYRHLEKNGLVRDNGLKIKNLLYHLFKNDTFTLRDTLVAVSYLFQRNFKHKDLIQKIKKVNPDYVDFVQSFIID